MDYVELIGSVAGIMTTGAYLPQVIQTWRTGSTKDISLSMFVIMCAGVALWLVYGLLRGSWPLIISNTTTLILAGTVLVFKVKGLAKSQIGATDCQS